MKDINGTELKVGDIVEIVKPDKDYFHAGDIAEITKVCEDSCRADFTRNKTYHGDGMWWIEEISQSTCKIITMEGYKTRPIDYSGCHPVIADALQQNLMIKCKVWDDESVGETSYIYKYNGNNVWPYSDITGTTWKNAEPIKSNQINKGDKGWMGREHFTQAHAKWLDIVDVLKGDYPWVYRGEKLFGRTKHSVVDLHVLERCGYCHSVSNRCTNCHLSPAHCDLLGTGLDTFHCVQESMKNNDAPGALKHAKTMLNAIEDHGRKLGYIEE